MRADEFDRAIDDRLTALDAILTDNQMHPDSVTVKAGLSLRDERAALIRTKRARKITHREESGELLGT